MSNTTSALRESAREKLIEMAQKTWEHSMGRNYHSLIAESDGTFYWSEKINANECGEAEYFNRRRDYWTLVTVGLGSVGWNGADEDAYATRDLTPAERKIVADALRDRRQNGWYGRSPSDDEIDVGGGEVARLGEDRRSYKGLVNYGTRWYVQTQDLLHFTDAHQDISAEEFMADALAAFDAIPVGFFGGEKASEEWEAMAK